MIGTRMTRILRIIADSDEGLNHDEREVREGLVFSILQLGESDAGE